MRTRSARREVVASTEIGMEDGSWWGVRPATLALRDLAGPRTAVLQSL
jgi:hypothetical protein